MNLSRKREKKRERQQTSVSKGEEKCLGVSAGLQDQGKAGMSQKGTYFLLVSAWLVVALESDYRPGMSLWNPVLGYGRQTASAPALQLEPDGDVKQQCRGKKKVRGEKYYIHSRIAIKLKK